MKTITSITEKITKVLAVVSTILIFILAVMYGCDVMGRFFFSRQITGSFEIAQFMLCIISFAVFPYAQVTRSHIHVAFVINKFPKKLKYAVSAIGFLLCGAIGIIMIFALSEQGHSAAGVKLSTVLKIPFTPIYYASAVFMGIFVLTLFLDAARSVMALCGNETAKSEIDKVYNG